MFKALLHHLGRAIDRKGRELWADTDCEAETRSEVDELEERLDAIDARFERLDERLAQLAANDERIEGKIDINRTGGTAHEA